MSQFMNPNAPSKEEFDALSDKMGNMIQMRTLHIADSVTINANSLATAAFSINGLSGYTGIGVLLLLSNNYMTTGVAKTSGGNWMYTIRNDYSSNLTTSIDAIVFYKKNT